MYQKILIPMALDHGIAAQALEAARALLNDGGAITALHVYPQPEGAVSAYLDKNVVRAAYQDAEAKLTERAQGQSDVTAVMRVGHAARTILDYAKEMDADCIVIGSHKPGFSDYLLGTTSSRVVRHANCHVLVMRPKS